jgi:transglutaminase-like putative cysteine protease
VTERNLVKGAEVALAAITLAAVVGMSRLFVGGGWRGPLLANAVAAHLVATVLRRRGVPLGIAAVVMAAAALLVVTWATYWSTTKLGIPTGDTFSSLRHDLDAAWGQYRKVDAPTTALPGFVAMTSGALWVIAYVADWAAFRLWVPFESTLPAATLFLFTALLGTDRGQTWAVALYAGPLLLFLLFHRLARQDGTSHWVAERRTAGHRSLLTAGVVLAAIAVAIGALGGPQLPGAHASGILDPHDLDGSDDAPRVTISPLVDIRSRLVDQANVEVFTVRSSERSYWRLTSLERFDGRIWSSSGSYGKAKGDLPEAVKIDAATEPIDQSFSISALSAIWLPSAYEAHSFHGDDVDVRYDEDSSTLIVSSKVPTSDGLTYQVTSTSPRLTPSDLTGTADEVPKDIRRTYTKLPAGFSPRVRQLAQQLTAGASSPYAQSRALQDHLRQFTYDLSVPPGHGGDALEEFLFTTKRGYCEQFAGAFAAMARSIGLPARVAVGFTPGDVDPNEPDLYHVRGEHAHAWPEVYFSGAGWVAFEPTPGRGMPHAEAYTGVPEEQAATGTPGTATTLAATGTSLQDDGTGSTVAGGGGADEETTTTAPDGRDRTGDDFLERWLLDPLMRVLPWALALAATYVVSVPLALAVHRRRRRARAQGPDERIALAWAEAAEEAALLGFAERPSDTHGERARRLGEVLPTAIASAEALARARERADYSSAGASDADVELATTAADDLIAAVRELTPTSRRVRRWFDPRPQLAAWRRSRTGQRRRIEAAPTHTGEEAERERVPAGTSPPEDV